MYSYVRLTHIVLFYNQSDGLRLSEQFSLVICYFKTIFFGDLLRCSLSLSFALYNIVLLVPSSAPHIKVILPPNSTSLGGHVIFIHFLYGKVGYQFKKLKVFLIINKLS